ncbi:borealin-2 [Periophthalmus magnuspinnatus]|uniref:borealin-2 n=1 Tax=Periophthalmus magnuspinnatus TaxID=409849 RepID=UPI00145A9F2E|nr:borealin-2 [Periophthalmus magnuspinnatus]
MPRRNKKSPLSQDEDPELRRKRMALFIQQFEKEAQERMRDLESKVENILATIDKVFRVELMKMPPSLKNMRIGDLISAEELPASDVSIALKNEVIEIQQPPRRGARNRLKSTDAVPVQGTPASRGTVTKGGKNARMRTRTLPESISTGNLRTAALKRTESLKINDQTATTKPKLRSVVSAGDMQCSGAGASAHITVTTREGRSVCFSEENKDDINLDLLDDVAWCQIQRLTSLMDHLSSRCQR